MPSATSYSICDLCGERHARGAAHIWKHGAPSSKSATAVSPRVRAILEKTDRDYAPAMKRLAAGPEPKPVSETHGPPLPNVARGGALIAPPGKCEWCDARRAYAAAGMRARRAKQKEPSDG